MSDDDVYDKVVEFAPLDMIKSAKLYVSQGIPPGGCLHAILANDLMESFGRADQWTAKYMVNIVKYVYNQMPAASHGSYEKVDAWLKMHQDKREEDAKN